MMPSGLRSQRVSVDRLLARSSPISRFARPLVRSSRTASSSHAFVNRFRSIAEDLLPMRQELSIFPKQVQLGVTGIIWIASRKVANSLPTTSRDYGLTVDMERSDGTERLPKGPDSER